VRAWTLAPPELLGDDAEDRARAPSWTDADTSCDVEATCLVHPSFEAQYAAAGGALLAELRRLGVRLKLRAGIFPEQKSGLDLYAGRWTADYPDADTFAHGVLHTEMGAYGAMCGHAAVDALSERARAEGDPAARHALHRDVERAIREQVLLLPLFHDEHCFVCAPGVRGIDDAIGTTTRGVDYARLWIEQ
jgi:ABC-type oligopeptide transport system substrate-binding subunit